MCGIALDTAQCVSAVVAESRDPGSQPFASGSDWFRYSSPLAAGIAPCQIRVIMLNSPRVDRSPVNSNKLHFEQGKGSHRLLSSLGKSITRANGSLSRSVRPQRLSDYPAISSVAGLRSGIAAFTGGSHFALEDF
jgi:hypothetical protein